MKSYTVKALFFGVVLLILTLPIDATRVLRLTLTELTEQADSVVVGEVISISARLADDGQMIWTDYEIAVEETLKGPAKESTETISFAGGEVQGQSVPLVLCSAGDGRQKHV